MTQQTGTDKRASIRQWADVTMKMWKEKIVALQIWDEGALYHSLVNHVMSNAGGDVSKIDFLFKQYGIYVDMGVGKETSRGNAGDLRFAKTRQPREWYSKVFFREVMKLKEYMAWRYGQEGAALVSQGFANAFDQRYEDSTARAVSSLRTVVYRDKNNERWRNNYRQFGFANWKSRRNNYK